MSYEIASKNSIQWKASKSTKEKKHLENERQRKWKANNQLQGRDSVRWEETGYYTLVLHFCILQCLCPRPLSTNYLLFLRPRGPWPPRVLQRSHSQCISAGCPLQTQNRFLDRSPECTVTTDHSQHSRLRSRPWQELLKLRGFQSVVVVLLSYLQILLWTLRNKSLFSGSRNSKGTVLNILCGTTGPLVRVL